MMKRTPFILTVMSVACALFFWSCTKPDDTGNDGPGTDVFNLDYTESGVFPANAQLIYNAAPVGTKLNPAYSASFPSNVDAELGAKGTSREHVVSIKGKALTVNILNPSTQNLDFMDSIWVYVKKYNSTEDAVLFGSKFNYSLGLRTLSLDMSGLDVKEVFNADSVTLILAGTKRAGTNTIASNTEIEFVSKIEGIFNVVP